MVPSPGLGERIGLVACFLLGQAACFPSFSGLTGGGPTEDAKAEPASDAPSLDDAIADGGEATPSSETDGKGVDAGETDGDGADGASCPSLRGPTMVRVPTIDDRSYCVDSTEVTQAQYAQFLQDKKGDTTGQDPRCRWNAGYAPSCLSFDPANLHAGLGDGAREYPITCVDWCDAFAFCAWAGKRLCGKIGGGGLPLDFVVNNDASQSQKYSACSRGSAYIYPYGRTPDPSACNFSGGDGGRVAPAGSYAKCVGGFDGLFDLIGNVQEWEDACDESDTGNASDLCVVRGGDFQDVGFDCRSLYPDHRSDATDWIGFRCCAE